MNVLSTSNLTQYKQSHRVVVVDDDTNDHDLMARAFEQVCPDEPVLFLTDGTEAIVYLAQSSNWPLVLITDLNMTVVGGLELVQFVRQHPRSAQVWVVVWTTSTEADDRLRCYEAGVNDFFTKPPTLEPLVAWIHGVNSTRLKPAIPP